METLIGPGMRSIGQVDLPVTLEREVPRDWTDYNGHMNEAYYLVAAAAATDRFLEMIGAGPDYVSTGKSFFTVETHIRYLAEVHAADPLAITTQVLGATGKKLHIFHRLWNESSLAATVESLLLHADLSTRRSCLPGAVLRGTIESHATAHAGIEAQGAGRSVVA